MARKAGKSKQSQDSHGTESRSGPAGVGGTPAHHPADSSSSPAHSGSQQTISTEKILESLEEAKKLESQLELLRTTTKSSKRTSSSSQGGGDDISTQKIRCMLCDKLSNIILDDPLLSESNDVVNRLWKICFYNRINELRSLITKEKIRAKKKSNPLPGEAISVKAAEQAKQLVAQYETQYKQFLNEAIKLYQYIIDRYTKELSMPPLSQTQTVQQSQSQSQQQSQLSQSSSTLKVAVAPDDNERSLVVISSLYKLNIHLGDLYRYSTQYKLSTNCYLYSSILAPSTGNPYNQLAVVAQSSSLNSSSGGGTAGDNQTVVALYYYARSLLATSIPFETSRSNLVRLFEANSKWMKEHLRDVNNTNTINIDMGKEIAPVGLTKKEQKEWLNKLRTTNNRKCLVMLVDLQWMFFKGVSLDNNNNSDGTGGGSGSKGEREKVDLQTLLTKMKSINNTISNLINHSSFSESLLLKLLSIFTFSTITSGNGGKIINTQGFEKKRLMNSSWNKEGIIITNQALVFSFLLDFITLLCDDVTNLLVKKMSSGGNGNGNGGSNVKLGTIRSLSALLLGVRYITMLYDGECEWFHGLPFFPTSIGDNGGNSSKLSRGSTIHTICQVSHTKFWKSLANLTNQIDTLPTIQRLSQEIEDITEIGTIKEYNELHGYVPFTSFLDNDDNNCMLNKDGDVTEYVNVANAIKALDTTEDDTSKAGGGKSGSSSSSEGATKYKLNLLVSIVNKKTILFKKSDDDMMVDGRQFFLTRKSITDKRELITVNNDDEEENEEEESVPEEEEVDDEQAVAETNFSPDVDMDVEDDNKEEEEEDVGEKKGPDDVPFLLTPAALLAASGGSGDVEGVKLDSILASSMNPEEPYDSHKTTAAAGGDVGELLLNNAFPPQKRQQLEVQQVNVPLPPPPGIAPPPGISLPPGLAAPQQHQLHQQPPAPGMGVSLADFTTAPPQQQQGHISFGRGTNQMPQDVPSYPSNMFETMNPFVQAPPPLAPVTQFNNNAGMVMNSSSSSLNQLPTSLPPGLLNTIGQQQQPPPQSTTGLDSTLDFLLSSTGGNNQSTAAGNAFNNLLVPSTSKEENDGESILNFLFDSSGTSSSTTTGAGQPLYGVPQTKNPFAT